VKDMTQKAIQVIILKSHREHPEIGTPYPMLSSKVDFYTIKGAALLGETIDGSKKDSERESGRPRLAALVCVS